MLTACRLQWSNRTENLKKNWKHSTEDASQLNGGTFLITARPISAWELEFFELPFFCYRTLYLKLFNGRLRGSQCFVYYFFPFLLFHFAKEFSLIWCFDFIFHKKNNKNTPTSKWNRRGKGKFSLLYDW